MTSTKTYSEKLRDPRWQRKRLEVLQRDDFTCLQCCRKDETLHVHHMRYVKGAEPWDVPSGCLATLCAYCHESLHASVCATVPEDFIASWYARGGDWNDLLHLQVSLDFAADSSVKLTRQQWDFVTIGFSRLIKEAMERDYDA